MKNTYVDNLDGSTRIYLSKKYPETYTIVDTEDVPRLKALSWHASAISERNLTQYARGSVGGKTLMLHRLVLSFPLEGQIDHIDQNGLNNRKSNLRLVSASVNCFNKPPRKNKKDSMPRGIRTRVSANCIGYNARIRVNGKLIQGGTFSTVEEAVKSRAELELAHYGVILS